MNILNLFSIASLFGRNSRYQAYQPKLQSTEILGDVRCEAYTSLWQNQCTTRRDLDPSLGLDCKAVTNNNLPQWCRANPMEHSISKNGILEASDSVPTFIQNSKNKPLGMVVGGAKGSANLSNHIMDVNQHQPLIDDIITTANSMNALSIDIDFEWPNDTSECSKLLQFLISLKAAAPNKEIRFALHPFDQLGMYFNHKVQVEGKTFKSEIINGNLHPVVFLYDLSNPNGDEDSGLYRQTPQNCEYPKMSDDKGAHICWDPTGDGSEDYDPTRRPFRAQVNIGTIFDYLEQLIGPKFKDQAIISFPFFARAVDHLDPKKKNTYSISDTNGFAGEADECGEITINDPLNVHGAKAISFENILTLARQLTDSGYSYFSVWQANFDTVDHKYLTELSDVWTLGESLNSISNSTQDYYFSLPHIFSDGSKLLISRFNNAYEIDANGVEINGTYIDGQTLDNQEFQLALENRIKLKRINSANEPVSLSQQQSPQDSNLAGIISSSVVSAAVITAIIVNQYCKKKQNDSQPSSVSDNDIDIKTGYDSDSDDERERIQSYFYS